jgi:molybdenum storage protein
MRESLLDKKIMSSTETPVVPMLPFCHVLKIGGRSIIDNGRKAVYPLVEAIRDALDKFKLVIGTGGGVRSRHVTSIGMDLGMPTGVLAQLRIIDALSNAHLLGTLLAPQGVVAIPPEILGHMLPFFITAAPGVICNGDPPFSIWEHPPKMGRIPPHRTDAGTFLLAECYGCASHTLIKDVDGLYDSDPKINSDAKLIPEIGISELKHRKFQTLPFDRVLIDLLGNARQMKQFQIINGSKPELLGRALRGEHVGTIVKKD